MTPLLRLPSAIVTMLKTAPSVTRRICEVLAETCTERGRHPPAAREAM